MRERSEEVPGPFSGLSVKLMVTIILVILAVEVVIYLPSVANFRANWLRDKLAVGAVAVRVLDVVPDVMELPEGLAEKLLDSAGAEAIVFRQAERSQLIERANEPMPKPEVTADLRDTGPMTLIAGALEVLFNGGDRITRIVGVVPGTSPDNLMEVLVSERSLRAEMLTYSRNIFFLSLIVASMTAGAIFIFVNFVFIRPLRRLIHNMIEFRRAPENATLIIPSSQRADEIGIAQRELAAMETELFGMLRQRRHLADLGLAVAKINHDLRNMLTSAQLLSDQVATLDDPKVQRLAPRLVNTLDKATNFAQSVLDYGRQSATPPKPQPVDMRALAEEAMFEAGLTAHPHITARNTIPDGVTLKLDPDQIARVLGNLARNAREALEREQNGHEDPTIEIAFDDHKDDGLVISVTDNGPGLPPRARDNLFVAFEGSARAGGTGLGLSIARELAEANGGRLAYVETETGTRFELHLPPALRVM